MNDINFKLLVSGGNEDVVQRVTEALKSEGFGVLTRIDLHLKVKEKLGKTLAPAVILGACNPQLAYDAYSANADVASLLPCNAVIREVAPHKQSVELARPSGMMKMMGDEQLIKLGDQADQRLLKVLDLVRQQAA